MSKRIFSFFGVLLVTGLSLSGCAYYGNGYYDEPYGYGYRNDNYRYDYPYSGYSRHRYYDYRHGDNDDYRHGYRRDKSGLDKYYGY